MAFQADTGEAPSTSSSTSSTTLLLDGKSPTLAPLARCGSRCSRSVRQLVERKLSPISTGLTFSKQLQESGHTGQLVSGDNQED